MVPEFFARKRYRHGFSEPAFGTNVTIVTLGNPNPDQPKTCSISTANKRFPHASIKGAASYRHAEDILLAGEADFLLVAGAYAHIGTLLFSDKLVVDHTFTEAIPAIVLVSDFDKVDALFFPPIDERIVKKAADFVRYEHTVQTDSNTKSVELMRLYVGPAAAITNQDVADFYNLPVRAVIRPKRAMTWTLFTRAGAHC